MYSRIAYFTRETWSRCAATLLMTIAGVITVAVSLCCSAAPAPVTRLVDHGTAEVAERRETRQALQPRVSRPVSPRSRSKGCSITCRRPRPNIN